jgi:hypothetical protein
MERRFEDLWYGRAERSSSLGHRDCPTWNDRASDLAMSDKPFFTFQMMKIVAHSH